MSVRILRWGTAGVVGACVLMLVGCAEPDTPEVPAPATSAVSAVSAAPTVAPPTAAPQRVLATEPAQLADDLVADERALRNPASPESELQSAADRQQQAYRLLGRHPEWDPVVRPRIPADLLAIYDLNIEARRQLEALNAESPVKDTVPAWRVIAPAPAEELLGYYRQAETDSGVSWAHLAAINLIETGFGRIAGVSTAGAQGPMQFLPSTFAAYGAGGDIHAPRDAILAAGRYLAANGFAHDRQHALFRYNNSNNYVRAVDAYAGVLAADPAAFAGYYRWNIYYKTTVGDLRLPVGYEQAEPIPAAQYRDEQALAPVARPR